jgi:restriction system protein
MASALYAIQQVLSDAGESLHYKEIARRILAGGLWETDGKTPEATVNAQLTIHIKKHGKNARFLRVGTGLYALNSATTAATSAAKAPSSVSSAVGRVSFTDAAEKVLTRLGAG